MTDRESPPPSQSSRETAIGQVTVVAEGGWIRKVVIGAAAPGPGGGEDSLSRAAVDAIEAWLRGGPWPRGFPLRAEGTAFQRRVWAALLEIPPGSRLTYGALADRLGTSPRAVGGACRANPIPLLIPCHRVVAAGGAGGFAGHREGRWVEIKRWLLAHE